MYECVHSSVYLVCRCTAARVALGYHIHLWTRFEPVLMLRSSCTRSMNRVAGVFYLAVFFDNMLFVVELSYIAEFI